MIKSYVIAACILLFASCSKDNQDKLFGKWQMQKIESDGVVQAVDTIYYNFQHGLFMYQIYSPVTDKYPYIYGFNTMEGDDKIELELTSNPLPVKDFLPLTDWTSDKRIFTIDKLTVKQLILSSEGKKYTFRKF